MREDKCLDKSVCDGAWDDCEIGCQNIQTGEAPFWLSDEGIRLNYVVYLNNKERML